jgi:DNA-binding NarL/FixJ family response regulator
MFKKVLISDDFGSINLGVLTIAETLGLKTIEHVQYCDDAYLKLKKGLLDKAPYDLLITDLSFKEDHRKQRFASGEALIKVIKQECPDLNIIVYSIEDRLQKVRFLMTTYHINAYVCKGRQGLIELSAGINAVAQNKKYLSPQVQQALSSQGLLEIDDYDIELIQQLALGLSQEDISAKFKQTKKSPSSLSSIEKRLNKLKIQFQANNATHLVAIAKDLGLI